MTEVLDRPAHAEQPTLLYGAGAIASYLGLTEHACRHLIADGVIPTFRIGARVAARRQTIDAWLRERETPALEDAL